MRISDWSSDVCSSDLRIDRRLGREAGLPAANARDFAHDLANGDGAVGGGDRIGGGASDLELVGAEFGEHDVGLDAGFFQCRDDARGKRIGSAQRRHRKWMRRREIGRATLRERVWQYV